MKRSHQGMLSRLNDTLRWMDNTVRWTGFPARVADDMSDDPLVDRNHRPLRWFPIFYIAVSCVLLVLPLIWLPKLDHVRPGAIVASMTAMVICLMTGAVSIHTSGPLGKPSREDDEREATLRKDSFLFCLGLLAALNCLGQPSLLILSHWQGWSIAQSAMVVFCTLMLNAVLLGTLPTLYASWNFPRLPRE